MIYTHLMNLAGQVVAIGNNFCVLSGEDNSNGSSEMICFTKDSHRTPLTNDTVGTQPFVNTLSLSSCNRTQSDYPLIVYGDLLEIGTLADVGENSITNIIRGNKK